MEDYQIIEKIREYFEENYELMRLEGGHAVTEDIKQLALTQVLYYFTKLKDVANNVTDTEVKLTLPDQTTPGGRNFTIEGVVDIVRDDNETWMYDIKTHDTDYIESNKELYGRQLNVYAYIWQELRGQKLDKTAIISTAYPESLKQAHLLNDQFRIQYELSKWKPLIDLDFDQDKVKDVILDFAETVDCIEDKKFHPASVEILNSTMEGTKALFATRESVGTVMQGFLVLLIENTLPVQEKAKEVISKNISTTLGPIQIERIGSMLIWAQPVMEFLMEKNELIELIQECYNMLRERDAYLFEVGIHEDSFNHRFGSLLANHLETDIISVDTEYNRHINKLKNYGMEEKSAIVDIVVHIRGNDDFNLVAFECKKKSISKKDRRKIDALIGPEFNYKFGVTIQYFPGLATIYFLNSEGNLEIEEFQL